MWTKFNDVGTPVWKFLFVEQSVLEEYTRQVIRTGVGKGIYYQEWRMTFLSPKPITDSKGVAQDQEYYLDIINNVIEEEKGRFNGMFLGAKIIYRVSREFTAEGPSFFKFLGVQPQVENFIRLRKNPKWRKLIAGNNTPNFISISTLTSATLGFDIVGQEDNPAFHINEEYEKQIDEVVESTKADTGAGSASTEYPFGLPFHTGESTSTNGNAQKNLVFLANYAEKTTNDFPHVQFRGGHTVLLAKQPAMLEKYNKLNIHSELCLISNNVLGTNNDATDYKTIYQPIVSHNSASFNGDDPTYQQYDLNP